MARSYGFQPGNKGGGRPKGARDKKRRLQPPERLRLTARILRDHESDPAHPHRFFNLLAGVVEDLGSRDALSTGEFQLARRVATVCVECEKMERDAIAGKSLNATSYGALTRTLIAAMDVLGLGRRPPTLSLAAYADLATKSDEAQPAEGAIETEPIEPSLAPQP